MVTVGVSATSTGSAADLRARLAAAESALAEETRRADALNRIAAAIGAGRELADVVQAVVDGGVELTGAAFGAFFYNQVDAAGESYTLYTLSGAPRSAFEHYPMPRNTQVFDPTFSGTGIVRSPDITADPRYGRNPPYGGMPKDHLPVRSYLAAPVVSHSGEVLGGLFFGHPDVDVFSQRAEELLVGLAAQAAVAADNARLNRAAAQEVEDRRRAEAALAESEARFRLVAEMIPTLCWMADRDGEAIWFNRRWHEYTGLPAPGAPAEGWTAALDPAVADEVEAAWRAALLSGDPLEVVAPLRGADGVCHPFPPRVEPPPAPDGRIERWFGVNVDVSAETSARERLQFALEAGRLGSWELDVSSRAYEASDLCKANYGRAPTETFTFDDLVAAIHPHDRERMRIAIEDAIRTGAEYDIEYRVMLPFGDVRWVHARGRAAQTAGQGGARRMAGVSLDVTDRKRAEERQRLLLNELNHRVKNTLATVQSIADQTLRHTERMHDFRPAFEDRLLALSQTHNILTQQQWAGAGLHDILAAELTPHAGGREGGGSRFVLRIERDIRLNPKATVALGMAVHELATNAVKYGSLSSPTGQVEVSAHVQRGADGGRLILEWLERGGPPVAPPTRRGFGGRLLENGLSRELSGEVRLDYLPAGLSCRIDLPMGGLEPVE